MEVGQNKVAENMINKYFDWLAKKKGFKSDKQRGMIYSVLKKRRNEQLNGEV